MNGGNERDAQLEIAHVLFADIVGYSKLLTSEQRDLLRQLNEIVRNTEQFRAAEAVGKLVRLPTGDGMVLAFFTSPEAPVRCALQIAEALKNRPDLPLRIGIHSGPVDAVSDVNDRPNVAGAGINMAQRVMDCGDAGHILLSKRAADDLAQHAEWQSRLHDLGEVEIKHGVRIAITNLCFDGIGNPALPGKLKLAARARRRLTLLWIALGLFLALGGAGAWLLFNRARPKLVDLARLPEKSIAVLPFENLSAEKDDAFFADGIQDDVLTRLGKIKELTVIARASVMTYRGRAIAGKLREIGQALGVSHVLEGSVRRSGDHCVINVQLIDTRNDKQVWSERYERSLTDALSLQGEVALEIARELQATLTPGEMSIVAIKPTENAEAYLLYLRARELELRLMTSDVDPEAISNLYQQAVDLDPTFALARARLSMGLSAWSGPDGDPIRRAKALHEAEEALRLRPEMGEAKLALACYYWSINESDRALAELAEAEKLLPNSAEVWRIRATIYRQQNKIRERIAALRRAEILDPRDTNGLRMLAMTLRDVRDWPEAERTGERVRAILPGLRRHGIYARAWDEFRRTGKLDLLKEELARAPIGVEGDQSEIDKSFQFELAILERDFVTAERLLRELPAKAFEDEPHPKAMYEALLAVARGGDRAGVARALSAARQEIEKLRTAAPNDFHSYINLGLIDAFLGRKDEAIREGRTAVEIAASGSLLQKNDASAGLALIYARTGESDLAIELIEHLLTVPADLTEDAVYNMTQAELKECWVWDPLRNDPRFQKILAGPEPKTVY
jgi:TolB-like protein/Flp pilus assembly protein TadD